MTYPFEVYRAVVSGKPPYYMNVKQTIICLHLFFDKQAKLPANASRVWFKFDQMPTFDAENNEIRFVVGDCLYHQDPVSEKLARQLANVFMFQATLTAKEASGMSLLLYERPEARIAKALNIVAKHLPTKHSFWCPNLVDIYDYECPPHIAVDRS